MLNTDDLRYHTEFGTGYSKDAMLAKAADEIDQLRRLASDAFDAWNSDRDSRVGKLLRAMGSEEFRRLYRPDLTKVDGGGTAQKIEKAAAPEKHYPEEWGPSDSKRLTCACGNPDPLHMTPNAIGQEPCAGVCARSPGMTG